MSPPFEGLDHAFGNVGIQKALETQHRLAQEQDWSKPYKPVQLIGGDDRLGDDVDVDQLGDDLCALLHRDNPGHRFGATHRPACPFHLGLAVWIVNHLTENP